MNEPLFTKQELEDYIKERGYIADTADMYDYYLQTEFMYVQGKLRIPMKNWRNNVNIKLRNGKFNARKVSQREITEEDVKKELGL